MSTTEALVGSAGRSACGWPVGRLEGGPEPAGAGPGQVGRLEVGRLVGLTACRGAKGPFPPGRVEPDEQGKNWAKVSA